MKFRIFTSFLVLGGAFLCAQHHAFAQLGGQRVLSTDLANIASKSSGGRIVSVTSTFENKDEYSAQNLIDGKVWSNNSGSRGWVSNKFDPIDMDAVTLGFAGNRLYKIGRIVINPANDQTPERWAKDIEIQASTQTVDGPWIPVAQLSITQNPTPQTFDLLPAQARFLRVMVRTNYGSDRAVALGEIEVYEAIDDSDPSGALILRFEGALSELKNYRRERTENSAIPTAGAAKNDANVREVQLGAAGIATGRTNVAATKNGGRVLAYSSQFNDDAKFGPANLIDGDNFREADGQGSLGWASNSFVPGREYVTLGFANDATKIVDRFVLNPASNQSNLRWARRMDVQVTTGDFRNGPWKDVSTINLKPQAINQEFSIRPVEAKYVRFVFRANGPGIVLPGGNADINSDRAVSLGEIEIYEAATPDDKLDAVIGRLNQVLVDMKTLRRREIDAQRTAALAPTNATILGEAPTPRVAVQTAAPTETAPKLAPAVKTRVAQPASRIAPPKSVRERTAKG